MVDNTIARDGPSDDDLGNERAGESRRSARSKPYREVVEAGRGVGHGPHHAPATDGPARRSAAGHGLRVQTIRRRPGDLDSKSSSLVKANDDASELLPRCGLGRLQD